GDGAIDSVRGARGSFTPIPDIDFSRVTRSEVKAYADFGAYYRSQWEQMDPVMVGVKRQAAPGRDRELISIDLHASPLAKRHYGWLAMWLGPPTRDRIAPVPGDMVSLELVMRFGGESHLFGGIRDFNPPFK